MPSFNSSVTPNEVVEVQTTRNGDLNRRRYIVDEQIYRPLQKMRAISKYNMAFRHGVNVGRLLRSATIQMTEELPEPTQVEVTAAASIGDTSITVADSSLIQLYHNLFHKEGKQNIRVNANPTSSTTIPCEALTAAINPGTLLTIHGILPGEPHPRSRARSRSTESHLEWGSKLFRSFGITYEAVNSDMYGIREKVRIQRSFMDAMDQEANRALYFNKRRDGSSDGFWSTDGLYWQGYNFGYMPIGTGVLTPDVLFDAAYKLMKFGNAMGQIEIIGSQRLIAQLASWDQRAGIMRTGPGNNSYGAKKQQIDVPIDELSPMRVSLDMAFDERNLDDVLLMVYWPNCVPIKPYPDFFQPDVQDPGTGLEQHQWVRYLGFATPMPGGNVILLEGINEIKGFSTVVSMSVA